jgi:hypothetical protein
MSRVERSFKFGVSSVKQDKPIAEPSDFTLGFPNAEFRVWGPFKLPAERRPPKADRAKRTQFGRVSGGDAQHTKSQSCETKPNLGGLRHVGKDRHRVRDGFAGKWNVQNEANSGAARPASGGRLCKTNPIWPVERGHGGQNMQNEANFANRGGTWERKGERAKQSQLPRAGGSSVGPRPPHRGDCAKRTQFLDCGFRISDCGFRKACGPPSGLMRAGCTNEPNWLEPIAQNEPNLGDLADWWNTHHSTILSFQHSHPMPIVQNEPNFRRRPGSTGHWCCAGLS